MATPLVSHPGIKLYDIMVPQRASRLTSLLFRQKTSSPSNQVDTPPTTVTGLVVINAADRCPATSYTITTPVQPGMSPDKCLLLRPAVNTSDDGWRPGIAVASHSLMMAVNDTPTGRGVSQVEATTTVAITDPSQTDCEADRSQGLRAPLVL